MTVAVEDGEVLFLRGEALKASAKTARENIPFVAKRRSRQAAWGTKQGRHIWIHLAKNKRDSHSADDREKNGGGISPDRRKRRAKGVT